MGQDPPYVLQVLPDGVDLFGRDGRLRPVAEGALARRVCPSVRGSSGGSRPTPCSVELAIPDLRPPDPRARRLVKLQGAPRRAAVEAGISGCPYVLHVRSGSTAEPGLLGSRLGGRKPERQWSKLRFARSRAGALRVDLTLLRQGLPRGAGLRSSRAEGVESVPGCSRGR